MNISLAEKALMGLNERYGGAKKARVARAPGRVNLIGEHTDYNGGYVLPVAIDRDIVIALSPAATRRVRLYSVDFDQETSFDLAGEQTTDSEAPWSNYVRGVIWALKQKGIEIGGFDAVIAGNVPRGSGLSSSAALEVATAYGLQMLFGFDLDEVEMALLCQKAENDFVGVKCGIMDQFISRLGKKDHALYLDCRTNRYELVGMPKNGYRIVICDTGVRRGLVDSEYNQRRAECERGVEILRTHLPGITQLRDVSEQELVQYSGDLPPVVLKRCRHVVGENARVEAAVDALRSGDMIGFGRLMEQSHESLRDDYQVSCEALDAMVESARSLPGVLGARMTGAGFGGCTVNLVRQESAADFVQTILPEYRKRLEQRGVDAADIHPEVYVSGAEDGAGEVQV